MQQEMDSFQEKMEANREMMARMEAKTDKKMKEEMLAKMEARIEANNQKFEVLRDTLISWLDAHHERVRANVDAW
jgi:DUF2075 family protein